MMSIDKQLIKSMRRERGWSQEQLAAIGGISERTIQRIERDGNCSLESRMALASAFEVSPADLEARPSGDIAFEPAHIDWHSAIGYIVLLILLPVLFYLLTNTRGMWELGCLIVVDGLILALSIVSHGLHETIRFFSNTLSPVKRYAHIDSYNANIIHARQVIQYAYTIGSVSSLIYLLVVLTQAPERFRNINVVVVEAAIPMLYAMLMVELWIRPHKHKMEKCHAEALKLSGAPDPENQV